MGALGAFSGAATVNLGGGSSTIDSIFHTNDAVANEDLHGESLDRLVAVLPDVDLLVIDEISTVGAAQFENVNRRLEQVGKVLWRKRFGPHPPDSLGGFDGHTGLFDLGSIPPGFKVFYLLISLHMYIAMFPLCVT